MQLIEKILLIAGLALIAYALMQSQQPLEKVVTPTPFKQILSTPAFTTTPKPIVSTTPKPTLAPEPEINLSQLERKTFELVNDERTKNNLKPLEWNEKLAEVARAHSNDMAANNYFAHEDLEGKTHSDRLAKASVFDVGLSAENLFQQNVVNVTTYLGEEIIEKEYKTLEEMALAATQGWLNSEGHRKNILLENVSHGGMGVAKNSGGEYYFTQLFAQKVSCGFKTGACCLPEKEYGFEQGQRVKYLPYCYIPLECIENVCVEKVS